MHKPNFYHTFAPLKLNVMAYLIYYYQHEENEKTFTNFDEARKSAIEDNCLKFRDTLGGEYFI